MGLSLQAWSIWGAENSFYGSWTATGEEFLAVKHLLQA